MYVIQPEYIAAAREKHSHPDQGPPLDDLARLVGVVVHLERTFGTRLGEARAEAGIVDPPLSRAAREEIEASDATKARVHNLYSRQCRRATSAVEVIHILVEAARDDLEFWELMLQGAEDVPAQNIVRQLVESKRAVVMALDDFVRQFAG